MIKRLYLLTLLAFCILIQVSSIGRTAWLPDLILIMVVSIGIFRGGFEGVIFGLIAGFFRGSFSHGTLFADILIFPIIGLLSSMLAKLFFRENPAVQIFITFISMLVLVAGHVFYLNFVGLGNAAFWAILIASWKRVVITILIAPIIFNQVNKIT